MIFTNEDQQKVYRIVPARDGVLIHGAHAVMINGPNPSIIISLCSYSGFRVSKEGDDIQDATHGSIGYSRSKLVDLADSWSE